jgi:hypothetical protein
MRKAGRLTYFRQLYLGTGKDLEDEDEDDFDFDFDFDFEKTANLFEVRVSIPSFAKSSPGPFK